MIIKSEQYQIIISFTIIIACIVIYIVFLCRPSIPQIKEFFKNKREYFNCINNIAETLSLNPVTNNIFKSKDYSGTKELVNLFLKTFTNETLNSELLDDQENNIVNEITEFISIYKNEINTRDDFKKSVNKHSNDYNLKYIKV